jgi:16S rRNA (uracil1498-N3)-methyltransferase
MQIFYAPEIDSERYVLDQKESRHIVRVLRMKNGDNVQLIDGKGNLYEGVIEEADQNRCAIKIEKINTDFEKRGYNLHIAISPLKNPERLEWFIEKAVEIGINTITPLKCDRTEKSGIKRERMSNIIISAMKQSIKSELTELSELISFGEFIAKNRPGVKLIAHCDNFFERKGIREAYIKGENATIIIGPEGDFSREEIALAIENGYTSIHLGTSRLRTETAGIAACHSIYLFNQ